MTDDQLEEILALWKAGRFYQAGTHASDLVEALRSAWVTTARLKDHAAFLNLENAETKAKFKLLESHLRSEVRSELINAAFTEGTLKAGDAMQDRMLQVEKERDEARAALAKQKEESGYPRLTEMFHQQEAELKAANETIAMLYERSGRFAAQADKYEQELKAANEEKEEAIRLGDERLA